MNWKEICKNCGECCGLVPFTNEFLFRHRDKMQRHLRFVVDEIPFHELVIMLTNDGKCLFLTDKKECAIYNNRPNVCRWMGVKADLPCPLGKVQPTEAFDNRFGLFRQLLPPPYNRPQL